MVYSMEEKHRKLNERREEIQEREGRMERRKVGNRERGKEREK